MSYGFQFHNNRIKRAKALERPAGRARKKLIELVHVLRTAGGCFMKSARAHARTLEKTNPIQSDGLS